MTGAGAAARALAGSDLQEALDSARRIMVGDRRDWSVDRHDAFLYGVFHGWEEPGALTRVAARHGWDDAFVQRLRRLRDAVRDAAG